MPSSFAEGTRITRKSAFKPALAIALLVACGSPPREPTPAPASDALDPAHAYEVPVERVRAAFDEASREATRFEASDMGVVAGRRAAELARVIALRAQDDAMLAEARRELERASMRKALPSACAAALDLARLYARDLGDLESAYREAYRTTRRFRGIAEREACVAEAESMLLALVTARPDDAVLAAIDADPDADDPSSEGVVAAPAVPESATLEAVLVHGGRAEGDDHAVRAVVRFDRSVTLEPDAQTDGGHQRFTIGFPGVRLSDGLPPTLPVGRGGLDRIEVSADDGGARVTFELEASATHDVYVLASPYRVVVDIAKGGDADRRAETHVRRIVIDPGHGGNDYGARHLGEREARITLDLAMRVARHLSTALPGVEILMTRARDEVVPLEQRTAFANSVEADLFVSIHLNAADEPVEHGGVCTFVLDTTNDRQALRLAARENGTSTSEVSELERILASLHRETQLEASRELATDIQGRTLARGREVLPTLPDRGVKSAMFYVLVGARMPAVLVEASFLTQPEEHEALKTDGYRQALADGMAEGIIRYATRPRR